VSQNAYSIQLICSAVQANNNELRAIPALPPSSHPNLSTIYLEGNPLQKELGTTYRRKIMLECPQVQQIDATFVRQV
jgi:protein phosphatase 1 regulatory subunit 7